MHEGAFPSPLLQSVSMPYISTGWISAHCQKALWPSVNQEYPSGWGAPGCRRASLSRFISL